MNFDTRTLTIATALLMVVSAHQAHTQILSTTEASPMPVPWSSNKVVYVAGLADVKPNSSGSLSCTQNSLEFANKDVDGAIPFDRITAVSVGDERVATGGTVGKVARLIPVYGVGTAMGAVTNKKVDLLTVEYLDRKGGYHGAVFEVPKTQAAIAQQQLVSRTVTPTFIESEACSNVPAPDTILVEPIAVSGVELPAEYRVLLYEQFIDQLRVSNGTAEVYRTGDATAPCATRKLQLTVTAFKKGNETVRASTGPVGFFVGTTSVGVHVSLLDKSGTVIFEEALNANKHRDGDSLSVTRAVAKSVSKHLAKAGAFETHTAP